jgi:type IV pilus biogenesis protein CpaD/CtpE
MMRWLVLAAAAAVALAGCSTDDADGRYIGDLDARGVPTGPTNGAPPDLGHAVCTDLGSGSDAGAKVMQVANLQLNHMAQFTLPQAEMIVYWAVTDLCPQYASQLRDEWKTGS